MKKITVVLPTFNRSKFLQESIESVLNQTYCNYELIIVDDGSTDNTSKILSKYNNIDKIKIFSQKNNGVSAARNKGIKEATFDWIAFIDSDDIWLPTKL